MRSLIPLFAALIVLMASPLSADTTITYQGQLQDSSGPYTGTPDMLFRLYDSLIGGSQIGPGTSVSDLPVTNGLFQVELDFGAGAFDGSERYLEIWVGEEQLSPRQRIAAAPMAVAALNVPEVSLADLSCWTSEVPSWNGTAWNCNSSATAEELQAERDRINALETENAALNSRVDDLEVIINDMATQLAALTSASEDQDTRLATIENSELLAREDFVVDLDEFLELYRTPPTDTAVQGPILRLTGANFQIINAAQHQTTADGTGNFLVGFSRPRFSGDSVCSNGLYDNQSDCESADGIWSRAHNSGSHNIVAGENAAYSQTGGIVLGINNAITGRRTAALAGSLNVARGQNSSVSGGRQNAASGFGSSVSGGSQNTASGSYSSVSGGYQNTANGGWSSVSGGDNCVVDSTDGWGAKNLEDCQ